MALRGAGRGSIIESYEFSQGYPRLRRGGVATLDETLASINLPLYPPHLRRGNRHDYL